MNLSNPLKITIAAIVTVASYIAIVIVAAGRLGGKRGSDNDLIFLLFAVFGIPVIQFIIGRVLKKNSYPLMGKGIAIGIVVEIIILILLIFSLGIIF